MLRSVVRGSGMALPRRFLTNAELAMMVDTSDEWIRQRTGIQQRHIADDSETTSVLGTAAARKALAHAGITASDVDLIICATSTPDHTFPATATEIQYALDVHHGVAFDVQAVCSGFVFALATADKFLTSGSHKVALVIGAETFSRILDWNDRGTCVLFGDGAGAVVLTAEQGSGTIADRGVLHSHIRSEGRYRDKLYVDGGAGSNGKVGHLRMEGREVFKHAVVNLADTVEATLTATGLTGADIDWFVPHQANKRIIDATAHKLGVPESRVVYTVQDHGNTSAASIPLALATAVGDGRIQRGQLVLVEAMGGGFTWGSALIRW
ncbi:MAG: ketoacyl-ACP synthase III [Hyphomicrobiales bacterium]|nr:ketoacyl-ACP synthase III [Hyphomicrobiales bacterium]